MRIIFTMARATIVALIAIASFVSAEAQIVSGCPLGQFRDRDGRCRVVEQPCPPGQSRMTKDHPGECAVPRQANECPSGQVHLQDGRCVASLNCKEGERQTVGGCKSVCASGYQYVSGRGCVVQRCPTGQVALEDGRCVVSLGCKEGERQTASGCRSQCATGYQYVSGQGCVQQRCPTGQEIGPRDDCVAAQPPCPPGQSRMTKDHPGECAVPRQANECPPGQSHLQDGRCAPSLGCKEGERQTASGCRSICATGFQFVQGKGCVR